MRVLSLFDGIAGAMLACQNLGFQPDEYFASEIDRSAIDVVQYRYGNSITQIGDVKSVDGTQFRGIDLLIGGSPCTSFSICGKRDGFSGESGLYSEYARILKECNPRYFLLENVSSMKPEWRNQISKELGVPPIFLNSSSLTAQSRQRYYWTNILGIKPPKNKKEYVEDIIEDVDNTYYVKPEYNYFPFPSPKESSLGLIYLGGISKSKEKPKDFCQGMRVYSAKGKSCCITVKTGGVGGKTGLYKVEGDRIRKLSPEEAERLQGIPSGYTYSAKHGKRYELIGNSFTIPIIAHILSFAKF